MLMQYFGKWPEWIDLFVESCKWNPSVHWLIYTDCGPTDNIADNVELVSLSFEDYKALVSQRLNLSFKPSSPYKLCDLKPCLAHIHANEIGDFRFFGFGDVDVVYGNIDNFYVEDLLDRWDVYRRMMIGSLDTLPSCATLLSSEWPSNRSPATKQNSNNLTTQLSTRCHLDLCSSSESASHTCRTSCILIDVVHFLKNDTARY